MTQLETIVEKIALENPLHVKKIRRNLKLLDQPYFERAEKFFSKYSDLLREDGKNMDFGIECYLKMITDMNFETVRFLETEKYSSNSFAEVNQRVYGNPGIMEYYMHGLLLSQFLWKYHYDTLLFFNESIQRHKNGIKNYLEIGGGHGLYLSEAAEILTTHSVYDVVDISESSLALAKRFIENKSVNYFLSDIFEFHPKKKYDFITLGEVIEHVEDPILLLKKVGELLSENGILFLTTPTNAPTIDHLYLFKNVEEIRILLREAGFVIGEERSFCAENLPLETAEEMKISILYCACLSLKNQYNSK